jgi:hypothetical protein
MRQFLRRLWQLRRAVLLYTVLLAAGWAFGDALWDLAIPEMRPMNEPLIHRIVSGVMIAFVIAAAIPFVPGAEIGFALLLMFGGKAAPVVYLCMVGALLLSYSVARLMPARALTGGLHWLGMKRTAELLSALDAADPDERPQVLEAHISSSVPKCFLKNRYLILALAFNLPGNSVLGGGGGLAFAAGVSGLYAFWPYVAVVACAVAPVPLFFLLMDA